MIAWRVVFLFMILFGQIILTPQMWEIGTMQALPSSGNKPLIPWNPFSSTLSAKSFNIIHVKTPFCTVRVRLPSLDEIYQYVIQAWNNGHRIAPSPTRITKAVAIRAPTLPSLDTSIIPWVVGSIIMLMIIGVIVVLAIRNRRRIVVTVSVVRRYMLGALVLATQHRPAATVSLC